MHWFRPSRENRRVGGAGVRWLTKIDQRRIRRMPSRLRRTRIMEQPQFEPEQREPAIRWELVNRVRREIAAGTYDTSEKLETAFERMLDSLEKDR